MSLRSSARSTDETWNTGSVIALNGSRRSIFGSERGLKPDFLRADYLPTRRRSDLRLGARIETVCTRTGRGYGVAPIFGSERGLKQPANSRWRLNTGRSDLRLGARIETWATPFINARAAVAPIFGSERGLKPC